MRRLGLHFSVLFGTFVAVFAYASGVEAKQDVVKKQKQENFSKLSKYIPEDAFFVASSSTTELWNLLDKEGKADFEEFSLNSRERRVFGANDIEEFVLCLCESNGEENPRAEDVLLIGMRWSKKIDFEKIKEAFRTKEEDEILGKRPVAYRSRDGKPFGMMFCFPDERTMLFSGEKLLEKTLKKGKKNKIVQQLKKLRMKSHSAIVCEIGDNEKRKEPIRMFCKDMVRAMNLDSFDDIVEMTKSFSFHSTSKDDMVRGTWVCKSKKDANECEQLADEMRDSAVNFLAARIDLLSQRGEWGELGAEVIQVVSDVIDGSEMKVEKSKVVIKLKYKGGLKSIVNQAARFSNRSLSAKR